MIQIDNVEVFGWEAAVRGMRNPMNSWNKSDSNFDQISLFPMIGNDDLKLMKNLVSAGSDHGKFMRMINVTMDITAPLYWWKEFDTYKVGTVADSCSTMHKIQAKEFEIDDFSHEHLICRMKEVLEVTIFNLNACRGNFLETKDKKWWWQMIQLLPSSYNQRRTVQMNFQVLRNIYHARKNHKLDEWRDFCKWVESLSYAELITM